MEPKVTNFVYRDNLSKKPSANKPKKKVRFSAEEKSTEGRIHAIGSVQENREAIRVKVRMTKEEAARLLSKCKDGGVLGFKDVAKELVQIPANRVSVVSSGTTRGGLKSIPEEL